MIRQNTAWDVEEGFQSHDESPRIRELIASGNGLRGHEQNSRRNSCPLLLPLHRLRAVDLARKEKGPSEQMKEFVGEVIIATPSNVIGVQENRAPKVSETVRPPFQRARTLDGEEFLSPHTSSSTQQRLTRPTAN